MNQTINYRTIYREPSALLADYLPDPLRVASLALVLLVLGYGAREDNGSPFKMQFLEAVAGSTFSGIEIVLAIIGVIEIIRRLTHGDYWLNRSPMTTSMYGVGLLLALVPFLRMILFENNFRFPLELTGFPVFVLSFFLWLQLFRREELPVMVWLVLLAGLYKLMEGGAIFMSRSVGWGLLSGWRDAMLLTMMVLGAFFAFAVKPEGDRLYNRIRLFFFATMLPSMFVFIGSTRRSFTIGGALSIIILLFYLKKSERMRFVRALPAIAVIGVVAMLATGSDQFVERMSVVSNPSSEGSASYRLIEVYNISLEIAERPIFGWPFGQTWRNRTVIEVDNISAVMPHNTYLYVLWRGGIVGLLVWLWMLGMMLRTHHRTIRAAGTPFERFVALWLTAGTISVIVAGFAMAITSDRLQYFYPFLMVMTSYLPGAFGVGRRTAGSPEIP